MMSEEYSNEKKENFFKKSKKKTNRNWSHTSFYISDAYKETHDNLRKIFKIDLKDDEKFKKYCLFVEGIDLENYNRSKLGVYIRYILTEHVMKNLNKISENKK